MMSMNDDENVTEAPQASPTARLRLVRPAGETARRELPVASAGDAQGTTGEFTRPVRTIAVTSGKGGVGKTFVTVNVGIALARRGLRVLVVDADLGLANVDTMLGLAPGATLRQVLSGERAIGDVLLEGPAGVRIVPATSGFEDMARLGERKLCELLAHFDELAQSFDVALIDTAAGIAPAVLGFTLAADRKLVVATPDPTALTDAYALMKVLATRYGEVDADVVVNLARSAAEGARTFVNLARVTQHFLGFAPRSLGHLPADPEAAASIRRQRAVLEYAPRAPVSLALDALAARLVAPGTAAAHARAHPLPASSALLEARP
ncbi:MAG: MinD/ParA family protein [Deltaproteobacteria bacterium]|nr:MinD/ParA family protein [Deltaproteobacteria bacterium]